MLKYLNGYKAGNLTPHQAVLFTGMIFAFQSGATIAWFLKLAKALEKYEDQSQFLRDIVSRNMEHLEEFDIIALRELGLINEIKDAVE